MTGTRAVRLYPELLIEGNRGMDRRTVPRLLSLAEPLDPSPWDSEGGRRGLVVLYREVRANPCARKAWILEKRVRLSLGLDSEHGKDCRAWREGSGCAQDP